MTRAERRRRAPEERLEARDLVRRAVAEAVGTFALTLVAAGALVVAALSRGEVDHVARSLAPGLLVMAFIYALGDASGAHFNPAVTLAFTLRRVFPGLLLPVYWAAQLAGALAAALLLRVVFGNVAHLGASEPKLGTGPALVFEIVLTWMLVTVILGTADRARLVGPNAAIAVGGTIALCGLFAGPIGGASMNPARSLGPALVAGDLGSVWLYVVGPLAGSILAVATALVLHGGGEDDPKTREAAAGDARRR